MNPLAKFILAALIFTSSTAAMACSQEPPEQDDEEDCVTTRSYDYIGIKGGRNTVNLPTITSGADTALGVVIGHRSSDLFSVELEYMSLGGYANSPGWLHATEVSLAGIHTYQMTENLGVFGRLGVGFTHVQAGPTLGGNQLYPTVSLGFEYSFNQDISARVAYDVFRLKINGNRVGDTLTGLTLLYKY